MSAYVDWIKEALARDKTKSRAGLAAALGLDRSQVTRMLAAAREIKAKELSLIAGYLGEPPPFREQGAPSAPRRAPGLAEEALDFTPAPRPLAPIYGAKADASGDWLLLRGEPPIDARPRAPNFENAAQVFGFYAPDDAMAPRFKAGEIVWVDPARAAAQGEDAVAIKRGRAGAPDHMVLGELRGFSAREAVLRQHKEQKDRKLPVPAWAIFRVLPRY